MPSFLPVRTSAAVDAPPDLEHGWVTDEPETTLPDPTASGSPRRPCHDAYAPTATEPGSERGHERARAIGHANYPLSRENVVNMATVVDLMGRLSNPPDSLEILAGQGIADFGASRGKAPKRAKRTPSASRSDRWEEKGRLSNPSIEPMGPHRTQTRLRSVEVEELVAAYRAGDNVEQLAERFGVHRTTVLAHLGRRQVQLRPTFTCWDHDDLTAAVALYASGASLASVAAQFGVDPSTVANRFRRAAIAIRPRRGWARG
jgi:transposase-like protein